MIRLMEAIMHTGICINGWSSAQIHKTIINAFELPNYTINQLRYDLRKMKAHGLVKRNGRQYSYVLTEKGGERRNHVHLISQTIIRSLGQQPFSSPTQEIVHLKQQA